MARKKPVQESVKSSKGEVKASDATPDKFRKKSKVSKSTYNQKRDDKAAYRLKLLGFSNRRVASLMGIDEKTLRNFIAEHESLAKAVDDGGVHADSRVAEVVFNKAVGGDLRACMFWLQRRQPSIWGKPSTGRTASAGPEQPVVKDKGYGCTATPGLPSEREDFEEYGDGPPIVKH